MFALCRRKNSNEQGIKGLHFFFFGLQICPFSLQGLSYTCVYPTSEIYKQEIWYVPVSDLNAALRVVQSFVESPICENPNARIHVTSASFLKHQLTFVETMRGRTEFHNCSGQGVIWASPNL